MTVYVDVLIKHDLSGKSAQVRRTFKGGACHMFTDGDVEELHRMAASIGMRREWFQSDNQDLPHYDINERRRPMAISAGAVPCDKYKTVEVMRANRARRKASD